MKYWDVACNRVTSDKCISEWVERCNWVWNTCYNLKHYLKLLTFTANTLKKKCKFSCFLVTDVARTYSCTKVLDVVAVSSPGIYFHSCWSSLSSLLQHYCPNLGRAVVGWAVWSREPSLSSAATVSTSRNHLTVVVNGSSYPHLFQTRIC